MLEQEREAAGREKEEEEGAEREAHKNGSPGQLSNGTGASPQGSREATLPAVTQQENGVPSEAVSVATAVVSATPVLPSMPQGVTLSNIVMDEVTGVFRILVLVVVDEVTGVFMVLVLVVVDEVTSVFMVLVLVVVNEVTGACF